jgi:PQQ-dependent catabolism-associated CXXCW motif protein
MRLPYPGLRPFRHHESDLFFGREGCVDQMVDRLGATRFLAVLGPSGSGKSSLVLTGLLDALEIGLCALAGSRWQIAYMRPENRPVEKLARALLGPADEENPISHLDVELLSSYLRRGPRSVVEWCTDGNLDAGTNLLILVDQFEELFRYSDYAGREEAEAFVALLSESARSAEAAIYVTITMRSEYLGACALVPGLTERINAGLYLVPRMTREEVREAITGPARVCGFTIEPALVNRVLNDLEKLAPWEDDPGSDQLQRLSGRADQLPLMQHVLNRMWLRATETKGNGPIELRVADYDEAGGLTGALDAHAREVFESLAQEDRPLVETIFRALVSGTTIENAVRRPCRLGDLVVLGNGGQEAVRRVVDAFRGPECNFLTPSQDTALRDDTVIDISHESLIRQWSTLRDWVRQEFESAQRYRHLETSAQLWAKGEAGPLRRPELDVALDWRQREHPTAVWAARYGGNLEQALGFLDASRRRRALRRRGAAAAGCCLFLLSVAFGVSQSYKANTTATALVEAQDNLNQLEMAQSNLNQLQQDLEKVVPGLRDVNLEHERDDLKVPSQDELQTNYGSDTPLTIPNGKVASTADLADIVHQKSRPLFIDALAGPHLTTILGAMRIPDAGIAGNWTDQIQRRLKVRLDNLTNRDLDANLVFFCMGASCWESYNASLRAIHAGYRHVIWYRGGLRSWQAAGLPSPLIFAQARELKQRLSESAAINPKLRWALAVSLSEAGETMLDLSPSYLDSAIEAEQIARDALRRLMTLMPDNLDYLADLALSDIRLASAFEKAKKLDMAAEAYRDVASVEERVAKLAERQSNSAISQREISGTDMQIGEAYSQHRKFPESIAAYRDAAKVAKAVLQKHSTDAQLQDNLRISTENIGALAYGLVLAKDYDGALEAVDFAISLSPDTVWMQMNRAHALMFLDKVNEAREIYLQFRGRKIQGDRLWEDDLKNDFAELRKQGLTHPLMDEIEKTFHAS